MHLSFNPRAHVYAVDGKSKPSVTGIMRACGLSGTYEFLDPIHAFRGTAVHAGSAILIAGGVPHINPLSPPWSKNPHYVQVHSDIPMYWEACRAAKAALKFNGCIYECSFIDPYKGYGGTLDFGAYVPATRQLWDIKSGTYPEMTIVQICAYEELARRGHPVHTDHPGLDWLLQLVDSKEPIERCGLRLEKTGRWTAFSETSKSEHYSLQKWTHAWYSCLALYTTIPNHEYMATNQDGYPVKRSHLSDLRWVEGAAREYLTGKTLETALRAGENLWNLREKYRLL